MSDLREFVGSDSCPELIRMRANALQDFLAERNIDASVEDFVSDHVEQRLTLKLTLDFVWRDLNEPQEMPSKA